MVQSINATTPLDEARAVLASSYDLTFTKAVARVTAHVRDRIRHPISDEDWSRFAPLIVQINRVKKEKNAAIVADIHQIPAIYSGVADRVGDDLVLVQSVARLKLPIIVAATVLPVAETLKLANPRKRVLIPDSRSTCPLASSITREDVEAIRAQYPGAALLVHINAPLAVKAVADAVFTATNALAVVEAMPGERVIMVPDQFLARNMAQKTAKRIVTWAGSSDGFGAFTADRLAELRDAHPGLRLLAHPQNPPSVAAVADFIGVTAAMADWIRTERPERVAVLGEDNVTDNLAAAFPETAFVRANGAEPPPKRVTLESVLWSLHTMTEEIVLPPELAVQAGAPVQRMLAISA